ncbi:MAG: hypothetical protein ACOC33_01245 [bacterium]
MAITNINSNRLIDTYETLFINYFSKQVQIDNSRNGNYILNLPITYSIGNNDIGVVFRNLSGSTQTTGGNTIRLDVFQSISGNTRISGWSGVTWLDDNVPEIDLTPSAKTSFIFTTYSNGLILGEEDVPKEPKKTYKTFVVTSANSTGTTIDLSKFSRNINIILNDDFTPFDVTGVEDYSEYTFYVYQSGDSATTYQIDWSEVPTVYFDDGIQHIYQAPQGGADIFKAQSFENNKLAFGWLWICPSDFIPSTFDITFGDTFN